ncbi:hypothetical protein SUGI_0795970 [Cryptomeria japonica]|uniref:RING-H2 finger protein ATL74 n=1 Tax=Cryptomeria japonica TaxID=3369 RepID=UPI002414A035|nr:RING-H2 finger protein ATL74 [Cryptomeria japonica]GLJ39043.1 hypothetical protein SUGI_0795970 [Cryptomeria japonica]
MGGEVAVEVARSLTMGASNQIENTDMSSDMHENSAVGIAVFLCALISLLGFLLILPWNSIRRSHERRMAERLANTGLKKEYIKALPCVIYSKVRSVLDVAECPICLAEFAEGEILRVLPKCRHSYHKDCVDRWLVSHSSCPSCRHSLVQSTERIEKEDGNTDSNCTGFEIECIVNS